MEFYRRFYPGISGQRTREALPHQEGRPRFRHRAAVAARRGAPDGSRRRRRGDREQGARDRGFPGKRRLRPEEVPRGPCGIRHQDGGLRGGCPRRVARREGQGAGPGTRADRRGRGLRGVPPRQGKDAALAGDPAAVRTRRRRHGAAGGGASRLRRRPRQVHPAGARPFRLRGDSRQGLSAGRAGERCGTAELLRAEPRRVQDRAFGSRAAHPLPSRRGRRCRGGEENPRTRAVRPRQGQGRDRLRGAGARIFAGLLRPGRGRSRLVLRRADGSRVRTGGLRPGQGAGQRSGANPVRVSHHQGRGDARSRHAVLRTGARGGRPQARRGGGARGCRKPGRADQRRARRRRARSRSPQNSA